MLKYIFATVVSLSGMSAFAQSAKEEVPLTDCKAGNIYEEHDPSEIKKLASFLTELRIAVKDGNKLQVAKLAHYPLLAQTAKIRVTVNSQKEFIQKYDKIFSSEFKLFLLRQQPQCIGRVGGQGFTVGSGQVWFDEYPDGVVRMFTINAIVYPGD